jgi:pimeloyl-ACP methyl ester carboxylesterase
MEIKEQSIHTGRCRVSWLEAGAGWPVILIHPFPLGADMWRPQLEHVPAGCRFIAPNLRGFGQTELLAPDGGPITMDDYASDISTLLDCLKIEDATIGGLSMGGYVTFALHRMSPDRFSAMILADTRSQVDMPQELEGRANLRKLLAAQGPPAVADQMIPKWLAQSARRDTPAAADEVRAMIESTPPAAIDAAIVAVMGRPDSTPGLADISCATLVIVGEHDEITPAAMAEAMHRAIPRSTMAVIAGAGHLSNLDQPAAFSRVLEDFLISHL